MIAHGYVVWQLNFPESPVTSDVLTRYTIDLTTFQAPPKPVRLESFQLPVPKKTPPVATKPKVTPKPKPKAVPKPVPKVVEPKFEQPVKQPIVEPVPSPSPPVQQSTAQPRATAPPASLGGSSFDSTASTRNAEKANYYRFIIHKLKRLKRYPSQARRRGDQGTVHLVFTLRKDGSLESYKIAKSSGSRALDREVERLIARAAPFPPVPGGVSKGSLELSVDISFKLR